MNENLPNHSVSLLIVFLRQSDIEMLRSPDFGRFLHPGVLLKLWTLNGTILRIKHTDNQRSQFAQDSALWSSVSCVLGPSEEKMTIVFPNLPYSYSALEPYMDTLTMNLHHAQHHQTYVHSLKTFLETEQNGELKDKDIVKIVQNAKAEKIRNNGGGHYNHCLFWLWLAPPGTANTAPYGNLSARIDADFGSLDAMMTQFNAAAATRFGSGWAWLGVGSNGKLGITSTPNQDNPLMPDVDEPMIPILGLDVWEHSYFLKYQNRRPEYIHAFWKLVNWDQVVYCYDEHASKQKPVPVEMTDMPSGKSVAGK
uniref:Superoxide dismutase [Fe] n=1 Tax=Albugo laibachii Nc14 TaxID=890382 RepID=F0WB03_9STRA|nr:manganese superoxide dismutase putative [Albugo laibachii Nc14]CCA18402.1 manganese superoxide dismutase putative [Albugo laibachii Nc14]|eukprot:CCA18402.1 manganese superoxide dismutase putative [Albugo laibachii Nc14]